MDKAFFDEARKHFGPFLQTQVDCANAICDLAAQAGAPLPHIAYMLATAWEEARLVPKDEIGRGAGRAYGLPAGPYGLVYYGRGFQLTWLKNYRRATTRLQARGILSKSEDLARSPHLVNRPDIASACLVYGMLEGWFTKYKLADFSSYVDMRQVYNGHDQAALIAGYAMKWELALKALQMAVQAVPVSKPQPPQNPLGALLAALWRAFTHRSGAAGQTEGTTTMFQGMKTYSLGSAIIGVIGTLIGTGSLAPLTGGGGIAGALLIIFLRSGMASEANKIIDNVVAQLLDLLTAQLRTSMPQAADVVAGLAPTIEKAIADKVKEIEARILAGGQTPAK